MGSKIAQLKWQATIPATDAWDSSSLDLAFVNGLDTKNYLDISPQNTL